MTQTQPTLTLRNENILLKKEGLKKCGMCLEVKEFDSFYQRCTAGAYTSKCTECQTRYEKERRQNFPEITKAIVDGWRSRNAEKYKASTDRKNKRFREKNKGYFVAYNKQRSEIDPVFKLRMLITTYLRRGLSKGKWTQKEMLISALGCSVEDFKKHIGLEKYNGVSGWQVDHIVPLKCAKTEDDVLMLNHFSNLRITSKEENARKHAKYIPKEWYEYVVLAHPKGQSLKNMVSENGIIII